MRQRIVRISLVAVLVVSGLIFYGYTGTLSSKNLAVKDVGKQADTFGPLFPDMRRLGEEAPSVADAEARIGRKIKLPDAGLAGGDKPMIRIGDEDGVSLIYSNDLEVSSIGQSSWPPGMGPREFYAAIVKNENETLASTETANLPNRPENLDNKYRLLEIAGNPGYGRDKDYQLIDGKKDHPLSAYVIWTQAGIQYAVNGAPEMPMAKVIEIAESVATGD